MLYRKNKNYITTGGKVNLLIILFKDVDLDDASSKINKYGEIVDKYYSINSLKITMMMKTKQAYNMPRNRIILKRINLSLS